MIAQHSAEQRNYVTPAYVVDVARAVMGGPIDYDPASDATANRIVRAERFDSEGALEREWYGARVWHNPPGGCLRDVDGAWTPSRTGQSAAAVYFDKLVSEWCAGRVVQACFLGFTLEVLRTTQKRRSALMFPFCVPDHRISFLDPVTLTPDGSPTHSNVLVWLPPLEWHKDDRAQARALYVRDHGGAVRGEYAATMRRHCAALGGVV